MKLWVQLVVVGALGVGGYAAYANRDKIPFLSPPSAQPRAAAGNAASGGGIPVEVAGVKNMEVTRTVEAVGTAQANEAVTITAKSTGIIERINFQEGQLVKAGSVLVELDNAESNAKLAELRAARDSTRLALERSQTLLETKSVAQAKVDDQQKAYEAAEARLRGEQAKFADSVIRAPFSGKLGLRKVSLGALVRPGDTITTLDDTSMIKLEFDVPETILGGVSVGNTITARPSGGQARSFSGTVSTIDSRVDPTTRAVRVRAVIPNADDALKPGMFMTVIMSVGKQPNAMMVPEEAVLAQGGEQFVFVIQEGKAARTRVTLGQRLPGMVQITNGLHADDLVAVTGLQQMRDGSRVRVTNAPASQPISNTPAGKSAS